MDNLIREDDRAVFADKGYVNEKKRRAARRAGVYWAVKEKGQDGGCHHRKSSAIDGTA
jgi:IS5 family transposase